MTIVHGLKIAGTLDPNLHTNKKDTHTHECVIRANPSHTQPHFWIETTRQHTNNPR